MLVALATMLGIPSESSTGNVIKVPPPAMAFTALPAAVASAMRRYLRASVSTTELAGSGRGEAAAIRAETYGVLSR